AIISCYLIGGVPVGVLLARSRRIDLRKVGSGNIGATNVFRALGIKMGVLSFLLDTLKGFLPVMVAGRLIGLTDWVWGACAVATVIGHCFSPYLGLTGGKGVATSLGIALALFWPSGVIPFALWIVLLALTRYVSFASIVGLTAAPIVGAILGASDAVMVAMGCATILAVVRHHENIARLLAGTENRLGRHQHVATAATKKGDLT
ncbi:MAG: glycerol-3-phosphate 1-O-acyltransferase PlsY, partial [Candidatus Zipacnadales bacterium]